jgi:nitrogen fixation/metabolism regulation signal transduction histidine kinase
MALSRFNLSITFLVICIALVSALFFYLWSLPGLVFTKVFLALLWIILLLYLLYFVKKINRELKLFLQAFQHRDPTIRFSKYQEDPDFGELHHEFNSIVTSFSEVRQEKEMQQLYLQATVENVRVGVLAFNLPGEIKLINQTARELLNLAILKNISQIEDVQPGFTTAIKTLKPGEDLMIKIKKGTGLIPLSIRATQFKMKAETIILVSMQNIKPELDTAEMDAWQKLIQVLRHEIMNSLGSINLLAGSLLKLQKQSKVLDQKAEKIQEHENDLLEGLMVIQKRSAGLIDFVQKYRQITNIPEPDFKHIQVVSFMQSLYQLVKVEVEENNINFQWQVSPENLCISSDEKLLEQVLLNIIKNSVQALQNFSTGHISIHWSQEMNKVICEISDNGKGIESEHLEHVFVPYFTTKKDGSGIGLALSRRIMQQLNGDISFSLAEKCTIFKLEFYIN